MIDFTQTAKFYSYIRQKPGSFNYNGLFKIITRWYSINLVQSPSIRTISS